MTLNFPPEALRNFPRISLWRGPSPIERLHRFEAAIGSKHAILIKRDDAISFGFGGNKIRKLDFVLAEAAAARATALITCGGLQSNHCRATSAAAARLGLSCHLVLSGGEPETLLANTRLDALFGATLHFVSGRADRAPKMEALASSLREKGETPFVIPLGASTPVGAAAFALAFFEAIDQCPETDVIVHSSSSGGTQGGLLAGASLAEWKGRIVGVSADENANSLGDTVRELARGALDRVASDATVGASEVRDDFVGAGYGAPTDESREAQSLLARSEGIVVDHTYTAKAFACLIRMVRREELRPGAPILFWHTGGQVGVFA